MRRKSVRGTGRLRRALPWVVMGLIGLLQVTVGLQTVAMASCPNLKSYEGGIAYGPCSGPGTCINIRYNDTCVAVNGWKCMQAVPFQVYDHYREQNCQKVGSVWSCTGSLVGQSGARDDYVGAPCPT